MAFSAARKNHVGKPPLLIFTVIEPSVSGSALSVINSAKPAFVTPRRLSTSATERATFGSTAMSNSSMTAVTDGAFSAKWMPQREDAQTILAFGHGLGRDLRHLLIHCHAGISRSTAAMAMILAQAFPHEAEDAIVDRLLRIRPQAWPNSRMIGFADEVLDRGGRLSAAVNKVYARRLGASPELAAIMRRLGRAKEVEIGGASEPLR